MNILWNTKYVIKIVRRSLLLRVLLNTPILVPSTTKRCLHIARGLVNAAIPYEAHLLMQSSSCEAHFYTRGAQGNEGALFYNHRAHWLWGRKLRVGDGLTFCKITFINASSCKNHPWLFCTLCGQSTNLTDNIRKPFVIWKPPVFEFGELPNGSYDTAESRRNNTSVTTKISACLSSFQ